VTLLLALANRKCSLFGGHFRSVYSWVGAVSLFDVFPQSLSEPVFWSLRHVEVVVRILHANARLVRLLYLYVLLLAAEFSAGFHKCFPD